MRWIRRFFNRTQETSHVARRISIFRRRPRALATRWPFRKSTQPLAELLSEFALMRNRVRVEVEWLIFLSRELKLPEFPPLPTPM